MRQQNETMYSSSLYIRSIADTRHQNIWTLAVTGIAASNDVTSITNKCQVKGFRAGFCSFRNDAAKAAKSSLLNEIKKIEKELIEWP